MDYTQKRKELEQALKDLAAQEKAETAAKFTGLPASVGLKTVDALILALADYASPKMKARLAESPTKAATPARTAKPKRLRVKFTEETKAKAVELIKFGKLPSEVAKELGLPKTADQSVRIWAIKAGVWRSVNKAE